MRVNNSCCPDTFTQQLILYASSPKMIRYTAEGVGKTSVPLAYLLLHLGHSHLNIVPD